MLEESSQTTKELSSILSPNQHRAISEIIFSGSAQKSNKSRSSEKRYSKLTQNFDTIDLENQEDPKGKLLTYTSKPRHRRKSSAGEIQCDKKSFPSTKIHSRNISDADSVIHKTEESVKKLQKSLRGSLPYLESTPCTIWCAYCSKQVHTQIELYSHSFSKRILNIFASLLSCCEAPVWLSNMKIHKCPHCGLVLGRVGIIN